MRAYDLILKKRNGYELDRSELDNLISGYVDGSIPDYQMAALAMAIYFRGMTEEEALNLTEAMVNSGDTISLAEIPGIKVDKHSTGGVGDTTTLVLAPLVAAAGAPVAKLSGRGLGHTGGTLDKLESIPGFKVDLTIAELIKAVREVGVAVAGQTGNLVPADKMLYALRDVTATVDSLPLIAGSIMSKKIAAGADALVLDVKSGDGAFLKDLNQARKLARMMVDIGNGAGRQTVAVVTAMEQPLGRAVGNAIEVEEAILTLRGEGPPDLEELCLVLGGWMLKLAGKAAEYDEGKAILKECIENGSALNKFKALIRSQNGNEKVVDNLLLLPKADKKLEVKSECSGYVAGLQAEKIGIAAMILGAGRVTKDSLIDPAVGLTVEKKIGDKVEPGVTLAVLYFKKATDPDLVQHAADLVKAAYNIGNSKVDEPTLILDFIEGNGK